ncbi:hypothetical protein GJ744_007571 [Endocarpon pusillum]|uniref:Uncharacterized protein n=1 Tax=Endocarpon pusillum TaxID=364733 RepID=A0A8H7AIG9_9EURO|nr:hypothetical protein GJ744_007571 [Endocarpon pusillum]
MLHRSPISDSKDVIGVITANHVHKIGRSDANPINKPRAPHAPSTTEMIFEDQSNVTLTRKKLSVRIRAACYVQDNGGSKTLERDVVRLKSSGGRMTCQRHKKGLEDLPLEIQGLILDYLFGDIHSVTSAATSLQSGVNRLSSAMRHPRRKALTDVALVTPTWRELVQERIYRHIKIKGNRAGLAESTEWFSENFQLTKHVRHIEFWVPVWADKPPDYEKSRFMDASSGVAPTPSPTWQHDHDPNLPNFAALGIYDPPSQLICHTADDQYPCTYSFSNGSTSATLSEIFSHIACFFSQAQIFTLEGGHCKKSNMIRQFPAALFPTPGRRLDLLPNIRTFSMRGAWNIMREYDHWKVIEMALPGLQEWHCSYAKPRPEAYSTINLILSQLPTKLRHVNISLDGFYCKDGVEGNATLGSSPQPKSATHHLCERLGRIVPQLESLNFTGRICDCFFRTATEVARTRKEASQLRAVDIVVKSCCRPVLVKNKQNPGAEQEKKGPLVDTEDEDDDNEEEGTEEDDDIAVIPPVSPTISSSTNQNLLSPPTSKTPTSSLNPTSTPKPQNQHLHISTITGSITHLPFILSFERLILSAVKSLDVSSFPTLSGIRIRFIDLDSACPLLNPYFIFEDGSSSSSSGGEGGRCSGVWNEEILEALGSSRPGTRWLEDLSEIGDGDGTGRRGEEGMRAEKEGGSRRQLDGGAVAVGVGVIRKKPRAIRSSAYRVLAADAR